MHWVEIILDEASESTHWGYASGAAPATEPVAVAALALAGHGRRAAAQRACRWLAAHQAPDGTLGISATEMAPHWPTGLAILAWKTMDAGDEYRAVIDKAL